MKSRRPKPNRIPLPPGVYPLPGEQCAPSLYLRGRRLHTPASLDAAARAYATGRQS